jgi:hypothetical protein
MTMSMSRTTGFHPNVRIDRSSLSGLPSPMTAAARLRLRARMATKKVAKKVERPAKKRPTKRA